MMKIAFTLTFALLFVLQVSAKDDILRAFEQKWENSKEYTLQVARAMPEEHYDFKPVERQMSFKEQLFHIRDNMLRVSSKYFDPDRNYRDTIEDISRYDKEATIKALEEGFEEAAAMADKIEEADLSGKVDFFAGGEKNIFQMLSLKHDHVTHQRGQLIVYLNHQGIEPPDYRGW